MGERFEKLIQEYLKNEKLLADFPKNRKELVTKNEAIYSELLSYIPDAPKNIIVTVKFPFKWYLDRYVDNRLEGYSNKEAKELDLKDAIIYRFKEIENFEDFDILSYVSSDQPIDSIAVHKLAEPECK